ncbi:MAG: ImmA/IrrE family metallo-endopeptidase [Pirellulales bacterium]
MAKIDVKPSLLEWALTRAGSRADTIRTRHKVADWIAESDKPTLRQLEAFAKAAYLPIGYLFLTEPPEETLPLPDLRTISDQGVRRPSADMLDTVHACLSRHDWYRDYQIKNNASDLDFVGSCRITESPIDAAAKIRSRLGVAQGMRRAPDLESAVREFAYQIESIGVLVMLNSIVGSNTRRALNVDEFRGFAIADTLAPLIFVNTADAKSAQMFTLAHELCHIWLGNSAISNSELISTHADGIEKWCNATAAEILVPQEAIREMIGNTNGLDRLDALKRRFMVSGSVILRRLMELKYITRERFFSEYATERALYEQRSTDGQANFYAVHSNRVGRRFAKAVMADTLEGKTLFRDAFHMLGISKRETFNELGRYIGAIQ